MSSRQTRSSGSRPTGSAETGRDDAGALAIAGYVLAYVVGDLDSSAAYICRALLLNPNLAGAWGVNAWLKVYLGDPDTAIVN
jgi:hypothetical protein